MPSDGNAGAGYKADAGLGPVFKETDALFSGIGLAVGRRMNVGRSADKAVFQQMPGHAYGGENMGVKV